MSKYNRPPYFTSPYSNISPPATCFEMARSSSHESNASAPCFTTAYGSLAISQPLSRSSSTTSAYVPTTSAPTSAPMRRSSSSSSSQTTWLISPYRSCLTPGASEATSYLSDDDLLNLDLPVENIPNPTPKSVADMTIEEQIARLNEIQEQEEAAERQRREGSARRGKQVRFQPQLLEKSRRPSQIKRRSNTVRKGLSGLNGPQ